MSKPLVKPTEVELLNPCASFRQNKDGNHYRVSFQVSRELWELFEAPNPGLRLRGMLWIADDDEGDREAMQQAIDKPAKPKKEKKPKPERGTWGKFWQAMYRHGALHHPGLPVALKMDDGPHTDGQIKEHLRAQFGVDSLTFVSPSEFETFCDDGNHPESLASLITISRQAAAEAQG